MLVRNSLYVNKLDIKSAFFIRDFSNDKALYKQPRRIYYGTELVWFLAYLVVDLDFMYDVSLGDIERNFEKYMGHISVLPHDRGSDEGVYAELIETDGTKPLFLNIQFDYAWLGKADWTRMSPQNLFVNQPYLTEVFFNEATEPYNFDGWDSMFVNCPALTKIILDKWTRQGAYTFAQKLGWNVTQTEPYVLTRV